VKGVSGVDGAKGDPGAKGADGVDADTKIVYTAIFFAGAALAISALAAILSFALRKKP
jgi:hypothetical protein